VIQESTVDPTLVQQAIARDVARLGPIGSGSRGVTGTVSVNGNWFSYRIEEIAEGIYNVGRITVMP